ncbi:MAG: oxidoreductase-like domain-containing protein [Burkholderiales bacterium]
MPKRPSNTESPPVPPTRPDLDECCHSGCNPCVFDLYAEAVERYRIELQAWEEREARRKNKARGRPAPS